LGITRDAADTALGLLEARGTLVRGELVPGGSGTEWCDPDVLRRLRRASLAILRREVEPADPEVLGRFLPAWQRIDHPRGVGGPEGVREVIRTLQGIALPAAQWETEVFPRRLGGYRPAWIDELAASGEIVWVGGAGSRVAIYLRDDLALVAPTAPGGLQPDDPASGALCDALAHGALFWDDLSQIIDAPRDVLFTTLWGLVWAGEVTNDLWVPLRAPRKLPTTVAPARISRRAAMARASRRGTRSAIAGRWSRIDSAARRTAPTPDERRRATAELLLERHGLVTRGAIRAEALEGGFAAIYPEFSHLEVLGACRRGYFVEGLGGAQFALAGAVERLRDMRESPPDAQMLVLGAADPAQPYGAALPWPETSGRRRPARAFGAHVVLRGGRPVLYVERGGHGLVSFGNPDQDEIARALAALAQWVEGDRARRLVITRIDGVPVADSRWHPALVSAGFRTDLKGMLLRA
jgi:ATP-dependent Lhr-like helicase